MAPLLTAPVWQRIFLLRSSRDRVISRGTPIIWPAHSPDLNPLDFHFWRVAQQQVYQEHPETIESLIDCVKSFAARYDSSVIEWVAANVVKRAKLCLAANGGHFQHLLKLKLVKFSVLILIIYAPTKMKNPLFSFLIMPSSGSLSIFKY